MHVILHLFLPAKISNNFRSAKFFAIQPAGAASTTRMQPPPMRVFSIIVSVL